MANPIKKIILRMCPCGSGKTIEACHLDIFDGRLRKPLPSLRPPGQPNRFSHPRCYLRDTCDCSKEDSREHYMSESVIKQLGPVIHVSGMPWLRPGETREIGVASLTTKILCRRHNAALAPLDLEAKLFFSILTEALNDLDRKTLSRKPIFHLVSGDALELWMLKVACGLYFAIGSKDGVKLAEKYTIDLQKVRRAFFERKWEAQAGLYFRASSLITAGNVEFSRLMHENDKRFAGATVSLRGLRLDLVFDTTNINAGAWARWVRRPSEFVLQRKQRRHSIILTWPPGTPEASVQLSSFTGAH
jgi:hypothetical protein